MCALSSLVTILLTLSTTFGLEYFLDDVGDFNFTFESNSDNNKVCADATGLEERIGDSNKVNTVSVNSFGLEFANSVPNVSSILSARSVNSFDTVFVSSIPNKEYAYFK